MSLPSPFIHRPVATVLLTEALWRRRDGSYGLRFGGVRSKFQVADSEVLNHRVEVLEGVLAGECVELLRQFFESTRNRVSSKL